MSLEHNIGRMNLGHLKTFHYVVVNGSFTKAAQALFLTQPAVSLQIQGLENAMHIQLFDRSNRQISLTNEGKVLFTYTQRLFALFDEIEHVFQDLSHLQAGNLILSASAFMATYYLPKQISQFSKLFPHVALSIQTGNSKNIANLIMNNEAEFGFSGRVEHQNHLCQVFLHREPYCVVAARGSSMAHLHRPLTIDEFCGAAFIMREKGTRTRAKVEDWIKTHVANKSKFVSFMTASSLEVAKQLVVNGMGITVLPRSSVADEIANGALIELEVEDFTLNADYYLTYNTERSLSAAATRFLALLKEGAPAAFQESGLFALENA